MKSEIINMKLLKSLFSVIAVLMCLNFFISSANSQTTRRNNQTRPVTTPTPPPNQTVPVIISRAEDIPSENQVIVMQPQPVQTESLEEKIEKFNARMIEMNTRLKSLESSKKNEYDEKQRRLLLNLDILTRAEQRAESLRKQLYELVEKENSVKTRLEQLEYDLRPEIIERSSSFAGSLRPEEIREQRKKALETEKSNLETLLLQIQTNRLILEENVNKADLLVEKVRARTEKEIDDALTEQEDPQ